MDNQNPQAYYQQQYQPQYAQIPRQSIFNSLCDMMIKWIPALTFVLLIIAGVSFIYYLITAVLFAVDMKSAAVFFEYVATGIFHVVIYCFFAVVLSGIKAIINLK